MSTRSLTIVKGLYTAADRVEREVEICVMYRHSDGYLSGHGKDLAEFLKDMKIVNGIGFGDPPKIANGAECLAAQIVKEFKDGPGDIYLFPAKHRGWDEEYRYYVYAGEGRPIRMKVCAVNFYGSYPSLRTREKVLFNNDPETFLDALAAGIIEE